MKQHTPKGENAVSYILIVNIVFLYLFYFYKIECYGTRGFYASGY
jgi:hypothetical protein